MVSSGDIYVYVGGDIHPDRVYHFKNFKIGEKYIVHSSGKLEWDMYDVIRTPEIVYFTNSQYAVYLNELSTCFIALDENRNSIISFLGI